MATALDEGDSDGSCALAESVLPSASNRTHSDADIALVFTMTLFSPPQRGTSFSRLCLISHFEYLGVVTLVDTAEKEKEEESTASFPPTPPYHERWNEVGAMRHSITCDDGECLQAFAKTST